MPQGWHLYLVTGVLVLIALAGVLLLLAAVVRIFRGRILAAGLRGIVGLAFLGLAGTLLALGMDLYTYHRFTYEQPVCTIRFTELGPRSFRAGIREASGQVATVILAGDEWQLDARVIKWNGFATLAGFDAVYRLDRISGRYRDVVDERNGRKTAESLATPRTLDIWTVSHRYQSLMPWVDATYGSATYMPMADGAEYRVSMSNTGLIARPDNPAAQHAVEQW